VGFALTSSGASYGHKSLAQIGQILSLRAEAYTVCRQDRWGQIEACGGYRTGGAGGGKRIDKPG